MPRKPDISRDVIAVDFETTYCTPKKAEKLGITPCSVSELGIMAYMAHPDFEAYLVAIVGPNIRYVGHPDEFDWYKLNGKHLIAHNAGFDQPIADGFLAKAGAKAAKWDCTADLAAFHGYPRSLSGAMKELFGQFVSKQVRNDMDGVRWESLPDFKKAEVIRYADSDSVNCLRIWEKLSPTWPEHEREISRLNRLMGHTGLAVDWDLACKNHQILQARLDELEKEIPWVGGLNEDGEEIKIGSRKAFNDACVAAGVPVPTTKNKKAQSWIDWLEEHANQENPNPKTRFARAMSEWTSVNKMAKTYETLFDRKLPNGRIGYDSLYFGAHTGRNSGAGGLNLFNLNKDPVAGTVIRNVFVPGDGHTFVWADLSQIEPRILAYDAKDEQFLELCRSGASPYVAHGVIAGVVPADRLLNFPSKKNADEKFVYACLKVALLQLQFMAGAGGLQRTYKNYGIDVSTERATSEKDQFRRSRPCIKNYWSKVKLEFDAQFAQGRTPIELQLLSGRKLRYWKVYKTDTGGEYGPETRGMTTLNKRDMTRLWPGLLTENCTQANARDCYWDMTVRANRRIAPLGGALVLSVYDEALFSVPTEHAEEARQILEHELSTPPAWAPDLPVHTEAELKTRYEKG